MRGNSVTAGQQRWAIVSNRTSVLRLSQVYFLSRFSPGFYQCTTMRITNEEEELKKHQSDPQNK